MDLCRFRCYGRRVATPKRPTDVNQRAFQIVGEATGEIEPVDPNAGKDLAAIERGRAGGKKGGKVRASRMTAEERSEAARKAAQARWRDLPPADR
jgi:hypothetical protein